MVSAEYFLATAVLFLLYIHLWPKNFRKKQLHEAGEENGGWTAQNQKEKAIDLGVSGTLMLAWSVKDFLWNDSIPPYERALTAMKKLGKVIRVYYNISMTTQIILVADLKLAKQILSSSIWLPRFHPNQYAYMLSFNKPLGVLFGIGQYWKKSRAAVLNALRQHGLLDQQHLGDLYSSEIKPLLEDLRLKVEEQTKTTGEEFVVLSPEYLFELPVLNIVFKFLLGRPLNTEGDERERMLPHLLDKNNKAFTAGLTLLDFFPFLKYFPSLTFLGEMMRVVNVMYDIVADECKIRRKLGTYRDNPRDILDSLLQEVDKNEGKNPNYFTDENLKVNMRDLIMAAGDTTSMVLQHFILHVALNPEIQKRMQAEIDEVIGAERWPSYDDKSRMIYTQAVILETLRFGSIVPATQRHCDRDTTIWNLAVKKKTYTIIHYMAIHHSKEIWGDPEVFRPERFIDEKTNEIINTDKIIPFTYGPRTCPGEVPARVGLFLFTVTLLREFTWEISDRHPPPDITKNMKGVTRAPAPFFVKLSKRTPFPT